MGYKINGTLVINDSKQITNMSDTEEGLTWGRYMLWSAQGGPTDPQQYHRGDLSQTLFSISPATTSRTYVIEWHFLTSGNIRLAFTSNAATDLSLIHRRPSTGFNETTVNSWTTAGTYYTNINNMESGSVLTLKRTGGSNADIDNFGLIMDTGSYPMWADYTNY